MKPGPPPKPRKLKLLEGNPGKRPIYTEEPMPRLGAPDKPDDLSLIASAEWDRVVPELDRLGLVSPVDAAALVVYCEAVAIHAAAVAKITESGVLIEGARGGERVKHPAVQIARDAASTIRTYGAEFGLTPAARARMSLPGDAGGPDDLRQALRRAAEEATQPSRPLVP